MDNESTKNNETVSEEKVQNAEKSKKSKKRSKNKKSVSQENVLDAEVEEARAVGLPSLPPGANHSDVMKTLKSLNLTDMMKIGKEAASSAATTTTTKVYKFWNTQPVPKIDANDDEAGDNELHKAIDPEKAISEIKQEPYALPEGFIWDTLDLKSEVILKELYTLLNENYVEDDDAMFRFDYQPEFLVWALQPPEWRKEW